jgi:CMP-N-acetylneuraminic acid synthetase
MNRIVALVPMKGHSERIPNKNLRLFGNKPLYHAILTSLSQSIYIDKIIINTDSKAIMEDALNNFENVIIHERPKEIQGDLVPMNDVIKFDVEHSSSDHFIQTHSTNPLLKTETINAAIEEYFRLIPAKDSVFSVTKLQTRLYWSDGKPVNHNPDELLRTQDLPPVYEENSNFYIFSRETFCKAGNKRIGKNPHMFDVNKIEALDIDEEEDFKLAEYFYQETI